MQLRNFHEGLTAAVYNSSENHMRTNTNFQPIEYNTILLIIIAAIVIFRVYVYMGGLWLIVHIYAVQNSVYIRARANNTMCT